MKRFSNLLFATALAASVASLGACQRSEKDKDSKAKTADDSKAGASRAPANSGPKPGDIPAPADVAAPPADALKTENGVSYKVIKPAATPGDKPEVNDTVEVHYTGWTTDGKMFDSSVKRGDPPPLGSAKSSQVGPKACRS